MNIETVKATIFVLLFSLVVVFAIRTYRYFRDI